MTDEIENLKTKKTKNKKQKKNGIQEKCRNAT